MPRHAARNCSDEVAISYPSAPSHVRIFSSALKDVSPRLSRNLWIPRNQTLFVNGLLFSCCCCRSPDVGTEKANGSPERRLFGPPAILSVQSISNFRNFWNPKVPNSHSQSPGLRWRPGDLWCAQALFEFGPSAGGFGGAPTRKASSSRFQPWDASNPA
ncbi:hypothetical protein TRVL_07798 [Trypanosoma vivax]|nr:hypothetical protein TRVL_07798 [Trypanosoma vivax]